LLDPLKNKNVGDVTVAEVCSVHPVTSLETVNYGHRKRKALLNNSKMIAIQIPLKNVFDIGL
jgi:hypothetical protein